jgi:hypothetical protein
MVVLVQGVEAPGQAQPDLATVSDQLQHQPIVVGSPRRLLHRPHFAEGMVFFGATQQRQPLNR